VYGDNSKRLTGAFETSSKDKFTWGPGDRSASARIPTTTYSNDGKGYIEDRRPASDINPYVSCAAILDTLVLDGKHFDELYNIYKDWQEWKKTADIEEV
jgi:glutamine synthetase